MKFFKYLLSLLIFFSVITLELRGQSRVVVDEIIGRVDDYIVLRSELESTYLDILSRGERISGNTEVCCSQRLNNNQITCCKSRD